MRFSTTRDRYPELNNAVSKLKAFTEMIEEMRHRAENMGLVGVL